MPVDRAHVQVNGACLSSPLELAEKISEDRITVDHVCVPDEVAARIITIGQFAGQDRAVHNLGRHPGGIDQPGERGD